MLFSLLQHLFKITISVRQFLLMIGKTQMVSVSGIKQKAGAAFIALAAFTISPLLQAAENEYLQLPNLSLAAGDTFPLKQLTDLSGKALSAQQFQGKYVLINFYSEHCAPCIREVPVLNQIMLRNKDIHVLAITPDKAEEAKQYLQQHALQWPVAAGADQLLFDQIGVKSFLRLHCWIAMASWSPRFTRISWVVKMAMPHWKV
jgi:peroxiredoxin